MKLIFHNGEDGGQDELGYGDPVLDNREEPVLRAGGEPFKSCCNTECGYYVCHVVDPSRSLAKPVVDWVEGKTEEPSWVTYDTLSCLVADMDIRRRDPAWGDIVAFHTLFPAGTADVFANSYAKDSTFQPKHNGAVRVLNNPWYHKNPNANERRLVEIAEEGGVRWALDRTRLIPTPEALAREIALLLFGIRAPKNVGPLRDRLAVSIAETMADWGLKPTVRE